MDTKNNTVSFVTTHFSTYMLVDSEAWYDAWRENIDYRDNPNSDEKQYYDIVFVADVSYSMEGEKLATAKNAIKKFIGSMQPKDEAAIVRFYQSAGVVCNFTNSSQDLYAGVNRLVLGSGTSVNNGLLKALNLFKGRETDNKKIVVLICDGDVNYVQSTIDSYVEQGIAIYAVNIMSDPAHSSLEKMAKQTGGQYYYGDSAESVEINFGLIEDETVAYLDTTDTDGDGLYDVFETAGIRLENGQVIYTDPGLKDTDGDRLSDSAETGLLYNIDERYNDERIAYNIKYFVLRSDPTKLDTDGDELHDNVDHYPWDHTGKWLVDLGNQYLKIEREDGSVSRGGNQGWWADKASSTAEKNFADFVADKYYRLMKMGCGVIAINDMELYLAQQNSWSNSVVLNGGVIKEADYRTYVEHNFDYVYCIPGGIVPYNTGLQPGAMKIGMERYLAKNNSTYSSVQWAPYSMYACEIEKDLVIEEIETMLGNNVPVVFNYYTFNKKETLTLFPDFVSAKANDTDVLNHQDVDAHYMTVIGLFRYVNEECEYEYILKVASWGEVYYIRYNQYTKKMNEFSNILRIA